MNQVATIPSVLADADVPLERPSASLDDVSEGRDETPWSAIERSPFHDAYVHELHWLAADVVKRADALFASTPPPPQAGANYIKVDADLHAEIYAILGAAAKIRALIRERSKRRDQSEAVHEVLAARTQSLRALLNGLSLSAVLSPAVRHSVEHFDERLDRTALGTLDGSIGLPVNVPFDIVVWSRAAFEVLRGTSEPKADIYPLRVYVASERVSMNAGDAIKIGELRDECAAIAERLTDRTMQPGGERGAFVVVLTQQSFAPEP